MISIRNEIKQIEDGVFDKHNNLLKNAPHTDKEIIKENWPHPYSREVAAFPFTYSRDNKYWPTVGRVDDAYGDRNLVCSCLPISAYKEE
jgi:glycine dehydrogenase